MNFLHEDDLEPTESAMQVLLDGETVLNFENRYRCADGSYLWLSWTSTAADGIIYATARDISVQKQLEQQLSQQTRHNTHILDSISDAFFAMDSDWRFTYINKQAELLLRQPAEALIGHNLWEVFPQEATDAYAQFWDDLAQLRTVTFVQRVDDPERWLETRIYPWSGGVSVVLHDITQQVEAQKALDRSEARMRAIVDSQVDLVCRYLPDTTLTFVNEAYCKYFGRRREDLIGKSFLTLSPQVSRETIQNRLQEVTLNPRPDVNVIPNFTASGETRWIQWVDSGITNAAGEVIEIQAVGRDVTEMVNSQKALADQKQILQMIFDSIPVIIILIDAKGRAQLVNRAWRQYVGWSPEELNAVEDFLPLLYPEQTYREIVARYIDEATVDWREFEMMTKDGSLLEAAWANVRLSDGSLIGIGQPVKERRELERQRLYARELEIELQKEREVTELKERFTSMVSHEFRTPLAVILSSAELIQRYHSRMPAEVINERLNQIIEAVQHNLEMLDKVLTLSRGNAQMLNFEPEEFELIPFVQTVLMKMRQVDDGTHHFVFEADFDGSMIYADPHLLENIFDNLLSNAVKYSPPESTITLQIKQQRDAQQNWWLFTVRDEGIGIPQEDQKRLFDAFHRARNARHIPGTGLGLAIVRQYIDLHHGEIDVDSIEGEGTAFFVRLPAY